MPMHPYHQGMPSHPMCAHQPMEYPASTMIITPGEKLNQQREDLHGQRQFGVGHSNASRDESVNSEQRPSHISEHT